MTGQVTTKRSQKKRTGASEPPALNIRPHEPRKANGFTRGLAGRVDVDSAISSKIENGELEEGHVALKQSFERMAGN
jgi:hypothetical protein